MRSGIRRRLISMLAGIVWLPATGGLAMQAQAPPVFDSAVTLTRLRVAVLDGQGRPVPGLGVDDFRVTEAGIAQSVQVVLAPQVAPLELAVILDFSGSIAEDWPQARARIGAFLDALDDGDCLYVLPFNSRVGPGVWGHPGAPGIRGLVERFPLQGRTRLYDALHQARQALQENVRARESACGPEPGDADTQRRRALVALSDGMDAGSGATYSGTLLEAWRAAVPIFPVAVGIGAISDSDLRVWRDRFDAGDLVGQIRNFQAQLRELARVSGGRLVSQHDLGAAYQELLSLLRGYYVIGYRSTQEGAIGWQPVEVTVPGSRLRILAQPGMYRSPVDSSAASNALATARQAFEERRFDIADRWFAMAASISDDIGRPYFGRGLALEAAGRLGDARQQYRRSLQHNPGVAATHVRLATVEFALGDRNAARDHAVRAAIAGADTAALERRLQQYGVPGPTAAELRRPAIYILSPEVPTLPEQLVLRRIQRAIGVALDTAPRLALTLSLPGATAYLVSRVERHDPGPSESLRLQLELFDLDRNQLWKGRLSVDDVRDVDALTAAASALVGTVADDAFEP